MKGFVAPKVRLDPNSNSNLIPGATFDRYYNKLDDTKHHAAWTSSQQLQLRNPEIHIITQDGIAMPLSLFPLKRNSSPTLMQAPAQSQKSNSQYLIQTAISTTSTLSTTNSTSVATAASATTCWNLLLMSAQLNTVIFPSQMVNHIFNQVTKNWYKELVCRRNKNNKNLTYHREKASILCE
ncbi:hypothetical protein Glove_84g101 [Diversispora epigaea]|uniref:Uncharacterized protein n=1 Tax=Diversispora epigaea TaxID=1348612 RepID=A0A397J869_9GLOM|nr:hypothetical protein Glove_84g101 [Diversispora epigaea]